MRFDEGAITADALRAIEDAAVREAVRLQESVGLDVVTDGEMRRLNFQDSFGGSVEGYDASRSTLKVYERRVDGAAPGRRWDIREMHDAGTAVSHRRPAKSRLKLAHNIPLEEYRFVAGAEKPAKVSLIGPDRISQRFAYESSTRRSIATWTIFSPTWWRSSGRSLQSLVEAGCRYVQIDAPGLYRLCGSAVARADARARRRSGAEFRPIARRPKRR